jgi:uncharacterized membrane protein
MNRLIILLAVILIISGLFLYFRKEKYGNLYKGVYGSIGEEDKTKLKPMLQARNSETYDVLNYALGGL